MSDKCNFPDCPLGGVDAVKFGSLVESVTALSRSMNDIKQNVKSLNCTMLEMRLQLARGKGLAVGLMIGAGGLGAGIARLIERML
jgi:hypothetical protein